MSDPVTTFLKLAGKRPRLLTAEQEIDLARQVQNWLSHPEPVPAHIASAGRRAKEKMVRCNLRLVVHVAKRYVTKIESCPGYTIEDALQDGAAGLARAAEKFDPSKGYKFSTYAYWWIRQGITRGADQTGSMVRVPIHMQAKLRQLSRWRAEYISAAGHPPTRAENEQAIAHFGIPPDTMQAVFSHQKMCSLDQLVGEDGETSLGAFIADPADAWEGAELEVNRDFLAQLCDRAELSDRERSALATVIGRGESLTVASADLGISREGVRQLNVKSLAKLRAAAATA